MKKILLAYYSRTGNTKKIAREIAEQIKCDVEEIIDIKNRAGLAGWLISGYDSLRQRQTRIAPVQKDPADYEMVILATPVWADNITPALRTYIAQNKGRFRNVSFLFTCMGSPINKPLNYMKKLVGPPVAAVSFTSSDTKSMKRVEKMKKFINELGYLQSKV